MMGRANLNLVLALVWLAAAGLLLVRAWLYPADYSQWIGWLALGMSGYNLARWWMVRSAAQEGPQPWRVSRRRSRPVALEEDSFKLEDEPLPPESGIASREKRPEP